MDHYFSILTQEARAIGQEIRTHIHAKLPHAMIGVYTVTLPATWFLEGFLSGLSSPELPMIWATFNTDAFSHTQWLEAQNIYYFHLGVLMLSKFQTPNDFTVIDQLLPYHDGIWINKFSRLIESRNRNDWAWDFELETTPLATDSVTHAIASRVAHHSTHTTQDIEY